MSETRTPVLFCPFCAEEDLHPHEASHGAWECRSCLRVFAVRLMSWRLGVRYLWVVIITAEPSCSGTTVCTNPLPNVVCPMIVPAR